MSDPVDLVVTERRDGHAVVTLNRPDKRNAISKALATRFRACLRELEDEPVVILTGAGGRAFCAGIDLNERDEDAPWTTMFGAAQGQFWLDTIEQMRRHPAVFISAVNGVAVGGGLTLVNNSELAVASQGAEFGMPELGFGAFPALAGPSTVRRVAPKHVAQMVLTATRVDAETALAWGLINEVVPAENLLDRASSIASQLAARDPVALAICKKGLRELEVLNWTDGLNHGTTLSNLVKKTKASRP